MPTLQAFWDDSEVRCEGSRAHGSPSPCLASLGSLNARTWAQALLGTSRHVQLLPAGLQGPHRREPGALEAPARTGPRDGREEGAENRRKTRDKSAGGNGLRVAGSAVAPRSPASSWQVSPCLTWLSVQWPGPWPVQGRSGTEGAQSGASRSELSERRRDGRPTWPRSHTFSPGTNFWGPGFETSDRTTAQKAGDLAGGFVDRNSCFHSACPEVRVRNSPPLTLTPREGRRPRGVPCPGRPIGGDRIPGSVTCRPT
ncbi:uncharacterized protein LOC128777223 [Panthera pardus]|uniref:Uncharacterized protein LOC128777223 n=1 Tax=Panthera pardus TaxID=9691 RepID=A0A9W2VKL0_PANPR|nr:uncharacterized protein LOC128777223 [Panthera pardus]XP_053759028.1 uncharacterized protein LOC128777223 [Panthera pardus]